MANLSAYRSIRTNFLIKLEIPDNPTLFFSDSDRILSYAGDDYSALGYLLNVTDSSSSLRLNDGEVTFSISAVPITSLSDFIAQPIRGSKVSIYRSVYNIAGTTNIATVGKFKGIVSHFGIEEEREDKIGKVVINFICKSQVGLVAGRVAGRRTNPADENIYFPNDRSMDRVPSLANAKIQFGGVA